MGKPGDWAETPRRTEVLRNQQWVLCALKDVKPGETIRVFEPDGTAVESGGVQLFVVVEPPYIAGDQSGRYSAAMYPITPGRTADELYAYHTTKSAQ